MAHIRENGRDLLDHDVDGVHDAASTSGVTCPRRERSPCEISMTVSRKVWMFFWRSSRFFFSSSRSPS